MSGNQQIDLSGKEPIAKGRKQSVYDHPDDPKTLVKVLTEGPEPRRLIPRYSEFRYGSYRPWHREISEYLSLLNRGVHEIGRLSALHGLATTSHGPALLVEKLTGPDGHLAPTLRQMIRATAPGSRERGSLEEEVGDLLDDLDRGRIIVGDLHPGNIVRAVERDGRLVVIDGLGERTLIPITQFSNLAYRFAHQSRRRNLMRRIKEARQRSSNERPD
ncbi:MAG: YrbL family protein [Paracoccaceae bacterium]